MKSQIIERLGQTDILMPSLIAEGLSANDRVKVAPERLAGRGAPRARSARIAFRPDGRVPARSASIRWRWKTLSIAPA